MGTQLAATVFVTDPDTRQTIQLEPGTLPEAKYAALVTNPAAWVDRKLPRLPKAKTDSDPEGSSPSGDGPDGASGDASAPSADADTTSTEEPPTGDDTKDTKPAARKTAATRPARGRTAAAEGTGGH